MKLRYLYKRATFRRAAFRSVFLCLWFNLIFPLSVFADLTCILAGTAEVLLPGAGYAYLGHWDKAISFGTARWTASIIGTSGINDEHFQDDPEKIYKTTREGDQVKIDVFLNRPTFLYQTIGSLDGRLALVSIYDLYDKECEENPETYQYLYAPFQFNQFATDYRFLVPIGFDVYASSTADDLDVTYHLDGVSRDELFFWQGLNVYLAGVGEELLFRGVIQNWLYKRFRSRWEFNTARWGAIVGSSALFGLAHSGVGLQASAVSAFFFSLYQGWIYHSYNKKFNLTIPIAIHSWGNLITNFTVRERAKIKSEDVTFEQARVQPLIAFNYKL